MELSPKTARKSKNINIRISADDLAQIKAKADEEGMPYQTFITSIVHKYISGKLVDEKTILRAIELLRKSNVQPVKKARKLPLLTPYRPQ
jgi:hypothetical protein